ncbi:MAG: hypothetical protein JWQ18_803, partial [Conexibacter sp.]|nr:hypothetical protein [Conexibacter sp.]
MRFKLRSIVAGASKKTLTLGAIGLVAVPVAGAATTKLVSGSDIKNGSITAEDINKGTREALHGTDGATGSRGAKGDRGATGAGGLFG